MPEIIDPVFAKTSPKRSFSLTDYERFGLVFTKTRVYKFGHRTGLGKHKTLRDGFLPSIAPQTYSTFITHLFVYNSFIKNVGPPLGLINYKKEHLFYRFQCCSAEFTD